MGLRGLVDAWGNPVAREGFTRPALTEPVKAGTNNSPTPTNKRPKPVAGTNNSPTPTNKRPKPVAVSRSVAPRGRGRPKAVDAARPWIAAGLSRSAYYRQLAKVKDSRPSRSALAT